MSLAGYESETLERFDIGRWIEEFFNTSIFGFSTLPEVEIHESDGAYFMEVDLPGLLEEDIDVTVNDNLLTIASKKDVQPAFGKRTAEFRRSFVLPKEVDRGKISTEFKNGMLYLTFPKTVTH